MLIVKIKIGSKEIYMKAMKIFFTHIPWFPIVSFPLKSPTSKSASYLLFVCTCSNKYSF